MLAAVLAAVGGMAFAAAFDPADLLRPVAAGALAGAGASAVVTGRLRRRLAVASLAAVAAAVPLALVACGAGPADLVAGLRDGARQILTSAVPVQPDPTVLVVPYGVAVAAAFVGAELAQRTRSAAAPLVPSLVAFALGLAFGLDGSAPGPGVVAAWVAAAALAVGLRRRVGRGPAPGGVGAPGTAGAGRGPGTGARGAGGPGAPGGAGAGGRAGARGAGGAGATVRRLLAVVPVVALVAAVAHTVGPRLPGAGQRARFELRDLVEQPAAPRQQANPLVLLTALQGGPDEPVFVAETSARVERFRLAVLDTYDGSEWSSGGSFLPAGGRLPDAPDDAGGASTTVTQTIEPVALEGRWLPAADRPVEVSVDDVLFEPDEGILLADGPLPRSYEVTSAVVERDASRLASARAADDDEAERARRLPEAVPDDVVAAAEEITRGSASAHMRATAIERWLAQSSDEVPFRLAVEEPPSGHSFGHLRCFLFSPERCGRLGSTEQFVAAYALLARAAGLPTRVVVGFAGGGGAGTDEVTAHEATAWPEVRFAGLGWVPFNPVPNPDATVNPPPADVAGGGGAPDAQTPTTAAEPDDDADEDALTDEDETAAADTGASPLPWVLAGAAGVGTLVASPAAVRGLRRRRRRRAPTAAARIAGAWAQAVDELAAAGVRAPASVAIGDVVRTGRQRLPHLAAPLVPLGELVNHARFARDGASDGAARAAWELSDAFTRGRRRARPASRRLREWFTVRSATTRTWGGSGS